MCVWMSCWVDGQAVDCTHTHTHTQRLHLPKGGITELFAFGGYSPLRRRALNDLHLLTVEYDDDHDNATTTSPSRYVWTRPDVQVDVNGWVGGRCTYRYRSPNDRRIHGYVCVSITYRDRASRPHRGWATRLW